MSDSLQHIKAGDPIRATTINAVIDGAKIARNLSQTGAGTGAAARRSNVLVRILNATGGDLQQFSIVALNEPIFEPEDGDSFFQEPAFRGTKPESETKCFAVLQTSALQDEIVTGCVAGVSVVKIDVQDESDEFVTCKDETTMESNSEGVARIIWKESGTGEVWGLILYPVGGGGGDGEKIYAVVMSAIQCPTDSTASPDDDDDFRDKMGEIKIEGKTYEKDDEDNYKYDKCACRELAGKDDDYPEQIIKGTQIEVIKGGQYDNPDYSEEDAEEAAENGETYDIPEKLDWYIAIETKGEYLSKLDDDVQWTDDEYGVTTFTVKDSDKENVKMSASGEVITRGFKVTGNAESYKIVRKDTGEGKRLVIVGGRCQQKVE